MFTLLTRPISGYYAFGYIMKAWIKKIFFFRTYGPNAVLESIIKGLSEIPNVHYNHDPKEGDIAMTVYTPIGIDTLRYALGLKKQGKIQKLIAGPNISIPTSSNDIFFHPQIDTIIVPSSWVTDYFVSLGVDRQRIAIIPAGVGILSPGSRDGPILIYKKDCPAHIFQTVIDFLEEKHFEYNIIEYGKFGKNEYLEKLDHARALIYLQTSESQGIALHEAWMKDVPTLVWNRGYWEYNGNKWNDPKISAPYLTEMCGIFFDENNFTTIFPLFLGNLGVYSPREYALLHFTNQVTTKNLLQHLQ